jgi:hypothetical protein
MLGDRDIKPLRERARTIAWGNFLSVNWGLAVAIACAVSFWLLLALVIYSAVD